ncbi:MAG TPA: hypothetical protein VMM36_07345 [Opitutaceae bacterium]|nr:hypothetical protein [Opitutaceae bacterium]
MRSFVPHILLLATVLLTASCGKEPVRTYRVAKENTAAMPQPAPGGGLTSVASGVTWESPAGWDARAPTSVRIGNYAIPNPAGEPADFAITSFPGDVGGDLANVNRWRNQIGMPPIGAEELPGVLNSITAPAGDFLVVNFMNPEMSVRVIAAIFKQPDKTWFFKLAGPDAVVAAQETALLGLLQTVRFGAEFTPPGGAAVASAPMSGNTNDLPPGHPPIAGMPSGMPAATSSSPSPAASQAGALPIRWAAPDHWIAKELSQLRKASYDVHGTGGVADFSLISLSGTAGGLHENVNRWRGQIGLDPQDAAAIDATVRHMDSAGLHFDVVEFASTGADAQRVIGALLPVAGETWFFKLTGPEAVVAAERESFIRFIRTVRIR